jgi:predicted NBD/HSP70 family sugar kinase
MPDTTGSRGAIIQDTVSLSALLARLEDSGEREPKLVDLMSKTREVTEVIEEWLTDAVRVLTAPLVAINCLLDLDAILIGGRLPMPLIARLAEGLSEALNAVPQPCRAKIMPAVMAQDAPAVGAAILPFLDHILPSDSILIQSGRR